MIAATMEKAGWSWTSIDRLAVTNGPGSFTGLRVGVAACLGLALGLDCPVVCFSTLEVIMAANYNNRPSLALIDAGRGGLYVQYFDQYGKAAGLPFASSVDSFTIKGSWRIIGSGASLIAAKINENCYIDSAATTKVDAAYLSKMAIGAVPAALITPLYLRPPSAVALHAAAFSN